LRMRYVAFFFIVKKAYHVTASAMSHSDSCNKANFSCKIGCWLFTHSSIILNCLTVVFTRPPRDLGFQENPDSAAPVQHLLGATFKGSASPPYLPNHIVRLV
jgi:hypothetical protein